MANDESYLLGLGEQIVTAESKLGKINRIIDGRMAALNGSNTALANGKKQLDAFVEQELAEAFGKVSTAKDEIEKWNEAHKSDVEGFAVRQQAVSEKETDIATREAGLSSREDSIAAKAAVNDRSDTKLKLLLDNVENALFVLNDNLHASQSTRLDAFNKLRVAKMHADEMLQSAKIKFESSNKKEKLLFDKEASLALAQELHDDEKTWIVNQKKKIASQWGALQHAADHLKKNRVD